MANIQTALGPFSITSSTRQYHLSSETKNKEGMHPIVADVLNTHSESSKKMTEAIPLIPTMIGRAKKQWFDFKTITPTEYGLVFPTTNSSRSFQSCWNNVYNKTLYSRSTTDPDGAAYQTSIYSPYGQGAYSAENTGESLSLTTGTLPELVYRINTTTASAISTWHLYDYDFSKTEEPTIPVFVRGSVIPSDLITKINSGEYVVVDSITPFTGKAGSRTEVTTEARKKEYLNPCLVLKSNGIKVVECIDGVFTDNIIELEGDAWSLTGVLSGIIVHPAAENETPQMNDNSMTTDTRLWNSCFAEDDVIKIVDPVDSSSTCKMKSIVRKKALIRYMNYLGIPFVIGTTENIQAETSEFANYKPNINWTLPYDPPCLIKSTTNDKWYTYDGTNYKELVNITEPTPEDFVMYGGKVPEAKKTTDDIGEFSVYGCYEDTDEILDYGKGIVVYPLHVAEFEVNRTIIKGFIEEYSRFKIFKDGKSYYYSGGTWIERDTYMSSSQINNLTEADWAKLGAGKIMIFPVVLNYLSKFKPMTFTYE